MYSSDVLVKPSIYSVQSAVLVSIILVLVTCYKTEVNKLCYSEPSGGYSLSVGFE